MCVCVCAAEQPFLCGLPSALDFINTLFCLARSQRMLKCTETLAGCCIMGQFSGVWGQFTGVWGHAMAPSHLFLLNQEAVNHPQLSCKRPEELVSRLAACSLTPG